MALVNPKCFGLLADIHRDSMAPDWLSTEHETGVSNLTLYSYIFESIGVLSKVRNVLWILMPNVE
jgi:hypothetical protein